jgi:hypothetical protein
MSAEKICDNFLILCKSSDNFFILGFWTNFHPNTAEKNNTIKQMDTILYFSGTLKPRKIFLMNNLTPNKLCP